MLLPECVSMKIESTQSVDLSVVTACDRYYIIYKCLKPKQC